MCLTSPWRWLTATRFIATIIIIPVNERNTIRNILESRLFYSYL